MVVHPSSAPKMQAGAYSDNPMPMVCRLYDICGGVKAHYKLNILNEVMCCFVMKNAMLCDGSKPYQPGTFAMMIWTIFGVFHMNGTAYSSTEDFNFKGGFGYFLKETWEGISENDLVFGTRSNRIVVEEEDDATITQAIENGTIDLENDVAVLQAALIRGLGTHWGIHGNKEMQKLCWMYFSFGTASLIWSSPVPSFCHI
jgi:hypothetical protein